MTMEVAKTAERPDQNNLLTVLRKVLTGLRSKSS